MWSRTAESWNGIFLISLLCRFQNASMLFFMPSSYDDEMKSHFSSPKEFTAEWDWIHHTHIYGKTKSLHGLNIHVRIISSCSNDFCHLVPLLLLRCYCRRCCDNEWWMNCWWPCRLSNVIELSSKTGLLLGHHSTDGWEERSGNWVSLSRRWRQRE